VQSAAIWSSVKNQILSEIGLANNVQISFGQTRQFYDELQTMKVTALGIVNSGLTADNEAAFNAASAQAALNEAIASTVTAFLGAVLALAIVFTGPTVLIALAAASAAANIAWGAESFIDYTEGGSLDVATDVATSELGQQLNNQFQQFLCGQAQLMQAVMADYGLLNVQGKPIEWNAVALVNEQVAGANGFEVWCWQILTPTIWHVFGLPAPLLKPGGPYDLAIPNGPVMQINLSSGAPQKSNLSRIFDPVDPNSQTGGGLDQNRWDVYLSCNGWNIPTGGNPADQTGVLADLYCSALRPESPSATGIRQPQQQLEITAGLEIRGPKHLRARISLHNRGGAAVSNVQIEAARLGYPGWGTGAIIPLSKAPLDGLPTRRRRLPRGHQHELQLTFPIPLHHAGSVKPLTLSVRGTFSARHRGGKWRKHPFSQEIPVRLPLQV
jgi:hypothetical protein